MPIGVYPRVPPYIRFEKFVDRSGDCHVWTGGKSGDGYGWFGNCGYAHRFAYEQSYGPIPTGLVIDHLCRNHACVNPEHLEAVTQAENLLRGDGPRLTRERGAAVTECPKGHPYTPENTRVYKGRRHCKECTRIAVKNYDERNRTKRAMAARAYRKRAGAIPNLEIRAKYDQTIKKGAQS